MSLNGKILTADFSIIFRFLVLVTFYFYLIFLDPDIDLFFLGLVNLQNAIQISMGLGMGWLGGGVSMGLGMVWDG